MGEEPHVARLLEVLLDADERTSVVLRSFRLPPAAFEWAREDVLAHPEVRNRSGYVVRIFQRMAAEGQYRRAA